MLHSIAGWWDGVEMWIANLPFVPQVVLMLAVMVPVSYVIATSLDRVINAVFDRLHEINHFDDNHFHVNHLEDAESRAIDGLPGIDVRRNGGV